MRSSAPPPPSQEDWTSGDWAKGGGGLMAEVWF